MKIKEILDIGVDVAKRSGMYPTFPLMAQAGVTRKMIDYYFGNITNFKRKLAPLVQNHIFDLEFNEYNSKPDKKKKRFFITSAISGGTVDENALKNIRAFCKAEDAQMIVLTSLLMNNYNFDVRLKNDIFITNDTQLNDNIFLLGIKSSAKKQDPVSGLDTIGKRNGTFIVASPKQRLKTVATGLFSHPHLLLSPGAITKPNYIGKAFMPSLQEYKANIDHVMGGLILELDKDDRYHVRQIQFDKDGSFIDFGYLYQEGKKQKKRIRPALTMGDLHSGKTHPVLQKATEEMCRKLRVTKLYVHDGLDSYTISHHNIGKFITLAQMSNMGLLNLTKELTDYAINIGGWAKLVDEVIIVKSNHDEHLDGWLNAGRYVQDSLNAEIGHELALAKIRGADVVEYAARKFGCKASNVKWLKRDESSKVADIENGAHGDKGANGSKGSLKGMERAYGKSNSGHAHSTEILGDAWQVGNMVGTSPDYGHGPSSWLGSHTLTYPNGMRQMINIIDGFYTTRRL